jgi:RNA polymerase sigma-70 factor, ECF subfamily
MNTSVKFSTRDGTVLLCRRVQGGSRAHEADIVRQREVVDAFLAASRRGDFDALLAVLDPDVILRADRAATGRDAPLEVRGAPAVAKSALAFSGRARFSQTALVSGAVGIVVAPKGRLFLVLALTVARGKVVEIDVIGDADRLRLLDLAVLSG